MDQAIQDRGLPDQLQIKTLAPKWLQRIHRNGVDGAKALNTIHRLNTSLGHFEFSTAPTYRRRARP
jgi:hypothetical protein